MQSAVRAYQNTAQREFRDQLVVEHLPFVRHVLGRVAIGLPQHIDAENLEAAGVLGLVEAAAQYDPSRGAEFRTFAYHRIRGAILDELRRNCPLPQQMLEQWKSIREAWSRLGEDASTFALARECNLSEEELEECLAAVRVAQPQAWSEELRVLRSASSDASDPAQALDVDEQRTMLAEAVMQLPERLRVVLSLYYSQNLRLAEIGEVLGLSESRVSRLLAAAQVQLKALVERRLHRGDGRISALT